MRGCVYKEGKREKETPTLAAADLRLMASLLWGRAFKVQQLL